MVWTCWKSEAGVNEYKKIGKSYPDHIFDQLYEYFLQLVKTNPGYREWISSITRIQRFDGSEYLIYGENAEGFDGFYGRRHTHYRGELGKYMAIETYISRVPNEQAIQNPTLSMELDSHGKPNDGSKMFKEQVVIGREREAFWIPFSKESLEELYKKRITHPGRPEDVQKYSVMKENGMTISVKKYEDMRDADFDTLYNYGCIPTKEEKQRIDNMRVRLG